MQLWWTCLYKELHIVSRGLSSDSSVAQFTMASPVMEAGVMNTLNGTTRLEMWPAGELKCDLNVIVSNHPDLEHVAQAFNIDFVCIAQPTAPKEKRKQQMESMLEDILHEKGTELIIMAR